MVKLHDNPFLVVENLSVRRRGRLVLNRIDWQIGASENWAIVGPNGAGKTTLVKALAGLLPTAGGRISFHSSVDDGDDYRFKRNAIGFVSADLHRHVFEREAFFEDVRHFTGDGGKALAGSDFILERSDNGNGSIEKLQQLIRQLRMEPFLEKEISALTTGEISKMLILKALLKKPRLLILDEPFNGLDRQSIDSVAEFIGRLIRKGLQVIMITHRLEEIIPEISHVLLITSEGVQKKGLKKEVLRSTAFQRVYRIEPHRSALKTPHDSQSAEAVKALFMTSGDKTEGPEGTKLVEMIDVNVKNDRRFVLKHVDWTIRKGENWMVFGPDGAGKTSLLKLITGENLQAYANDVFLFGRKKGSGESVWDIKQKIGWVSSDLQSKYPDNIKAVEVVYSGFFDSMGLYRNTSAAERRVAKQWLAALGIDYLAEKTYGYLSHGQKQMLLIARAMVKAPPLLLLNEPCEGLDLVNRSKVIEMIEFIGRRTPTTLVYATCDETSAPPCITHKLILNRGMANSTFDGK